MVHPERRHLDLRSEVLHLSFFSNTLLSLLSVRSELTSPRFASFLRTLIFIPPPAPRPPPHPRLTRLFSIFLVCLLFCRAFAQDCRWRCSSAFPVRPPPSLFLVVEVVPREYYSFPYSICGATPCFTVALSSLFFHLGECFNACSLIASPSTRDPNKYVPVH